MAAKCSEGLLIGARPLELAETACRGLVDEEWVVDGALMLDAGPTWAGAINTALVKRGVRVSELRKIGERFDLCPTHREFIRNSSSCGLCAS